MKRSESQGQTPVPTSRIRRVSRPSPSQFSREVIVVVIVAVFWAVLFSGFLRVTGREAAGDATANAATTVPISDTEGTSDAEAIGFLRDVKPILDRRCVKCHGGERTEEGLDLTSYDGTISGSWNGPVIDPGKPGDSLLVELIENGDMPKNGPSLLPVETRTIVEWIRAGALDS